MPTYNDYIGQAQTYMQNEQANDPAFQEWQSMASMYTPEMGQAPAWQGRDYFSDWMQQLPDKGADYLQQYQIQKANDAKSFTGRLGQLMSFIPGAVLAAGAAPALGSLFGGGEAAAAANSAAYTNPAYTSIPGSIDLANPFLDPNFVSIPGAFEGAGSLASNPYTNPAFVNIPGSAPSAGINPMSMFNGMTENGVAGFNSLFDSFAGLDMADAAMAGVPSVSALSSIGGGEGSYNNSAYTSIPTGGNVPSSTGNPIEDFFRKLGKGTGTIGGISNLVSGLAGLYGDYRSQSTYRDAASNLQNMFGDNSAYAQNLRKELQRRDAAAGRRSQYGPRAVELQAKLAEMNARNTPSLINLFDKQSNARNDSLKSLLDILNAANILPTPRLP